MSKDKIQALDEALAEIFSEPPLISTNAEQSSPVFDHAVLAGIFSEPLPIKTDTKPSPPSFDHQALAEIFSELPPIPMNPKASSLSFDTGPASPPFSGQLDNEPAAKTVAVANAESARPQWAKSLLAELRFVFSANAEPPPSGVEDDPSPPSLSGQLHTLEPMAEAIAADAESARPQQAKPLLTEPSPLISANSDLPPLRFEEETPSPPVSGQLDNGEPVAKTVAVAPSTNAESARPQRTKSLLGELRYIFSTKAEPPPSGVEDDPSPPSLSGQLYKLEALAKAIAAGSPTDAESARPPRATAETSSLISTNTEPSAPNFVKKSSPPTVAGRLDNVDPGVKDVAVAAPADAEYARPQLATSLLVEPLPPTSTNKPPPPIFGKEPARPILSSRLELAEKPDVEPPQQANSLTELPLLISTNTKPPPAIFETEPSQPILSGQLDNLELAANATPSDAESAGAGQAKSLLTELPALISVSTETSLPVRDKASRSTLSGQPDNVEPAPEIVAAAPPTDTESARPQAKSLLAELPPLISIEIKPSPRNFETGPSPPTLSGQLDNVGPVASTVAAVPATSAESVRPQQAKSLLAELPPMISADAKPPRPIFEKEPSRPTLSSQLNNLGPAAKAVSVAPPTDAESAVMQPRGPKPLLSEVHSLDLTNTKPPPVIFENEPSPISLSGQPDHAEPAAKIVAAAHPADAEGARPQRAKSLLAELPPSRPFLEREPSPTTFPGELDTVAPAVKTVVVAPPTQTKSLSLTDLPPLVSTNTELSPPIFEENSPPPSLSGQLDNVEPVAKAVAVAPPTDAQSTLPRHAKSLQAEKLPPISTNTFEEAPSRPTFYGRLDNVGPAVRALAVSPPPATDGAVTRAQQAKSVLTELDLNTAIRLRWLMRDIRGKRTAISPEIENDLAALVELGLVEMREKLPNLTALGTLALD